MKSCLRWMPIVVLSIYGFGCATLPPSPKPDGNGDWVLAVDGKSGQVKWSRETSQSTRQPIPSFSSNSSTLNQINAPSNSNTQPSTVLVAVGETQDDIFARCGQPSLWMKQTTQTPQAHFFKTEPVMVITFFRNPANNLIAGEIRYTLPEELAKDKALSEPIVQKILDANTMGQSWNKDTNTAHFVIASTYRREGATATWSGGRITVVLDAYKAFAEAERKKLGAEQAERLGGIKK